MHPNHPTRTSGQLKRPFESELSSYPATSKRTKSDGAQPPAAASNALQSMYEHLIPNSIPLYLPGRDADLPKVFRVESHPLCTSKHRNIYVYLLDMTAEGMVKALEVGARVTIPRGGVDEIRKQGMSQSTCQYILLTENPQVYSSYTKETMYFVGTLQEMETL
jgi:hypothetical protein